MGAAPDPRIPGEVRALLDAIRTFIDREVRPLEADHPEVLLEGGMHPKFHELAREVQRRSVGAGFYALHMPPDVGGAGLGELAMCLVREAVAASGAMLTLNMLGDLPFGPNRMLYELATPEQRERYLLPLVRGEKTTCFALSEPGAGSDLGAIRTKAERRGAGWRLSGSKTFITNAPFADFAHVLARTGRGHTFFLVDRDTPGYEVGPVQRSMADDGLQAELFFADCPLPEGALLGEEGEALAYAVRFLSSERLAIAATATGIAQHLVDRCLEHARSRVQFGRPIGEFQAIQWMIADSLIELEASRALLHEVAFRADQGEDVFRQVAMAKVFCTEAVGRIADRAVQIHGGSGYMRDSPVERLYRLVRVLRIGGGTSEIQRLIIAKASGL